MAGNAKAIREAARRAGAAMRAQPDSKPVDLGRNAYAVRPGGPTPAEASRPLDMAKFKAKRLIEGGPGDERIKPKPTARPRAPRSGAEQVARDGEAFQLRAERSMERRAGVRGNPKPRIPKPGGAAEAGERSVVKATSRAVQSVGDGAADAEVVSRGFRRKAAARMAGRIGRGALEVGEKFAGPVGAALAAKDVYDAGKWAQRQGDSSPRTMPTKARSGGMTVHPTNPGREPKAAAAHSASSSYRPNMTKSTGIAYKKGGLR